MLEALISLRRNGATTKKPRGYVIAVKLAGSPWGNKEKTIHQVVEWVDDELEAKLNAMKDAGEPYPVITLPYAVMNGDDITSFGSKTVDLASLNRSDINDPDTDAGIVRISDIRGRIGDS